MSHQKKEHTKKSDQKALMEECLVELKEGKGRPGDPSRQKCNLST
jgi:hypothetical protein